MTHKDIPVVGDEIDFIELFKKGKEMLQGEKIIEKLNIAIIGKTGVGKSSLINVIFGEEFATTGSGKPVTQEIQQYTSKDSNLTIYDTKGLEIKNRNTIYDIESFIDEQESKDVDSQIHIAWLCIAESSRRIEPAELEMYQMLKQKKFPTMVVITKAECDKDSKGVKFSDIVKNEFNIDDEHMQRVRAVEIEDDDGLIKPVKKQWIDDLLDKSYKLLPEAKKGALARLQKYNKELKRKQCQKDAKNLINTYAAAAAGVCATPIPFSDIALILPTQIAMIVHISRIYDMELNIETIKTIAVTLCAVCATGMLARFLASVGGNVLKFIPLAGTLAGTALNSSVALSTTKAMGELYIKYLDSNFDEIYKGKTPSFSKDDFNKVKKGV